MPHRYAIALVALTCSVSPAQAQPRPSQGTRPPVAPAALKPADIIRLALPATVLIETKTASGAEGIGSGFVLDPNGIIATNFHVIRGAVSAKVSLQNGDSYDRVTVRAYDEKKDIAILQVPAFKLPAVALGDSDSVTQGESVVLLGSPLGLGGTATTGIVSAVRPLDGYRVFQTDAAANPGNSGGPMLNDKGEVVGILTFGVRDKENLNFVVPINYARGLAGLNDGISLTALAERHPEMVRPAAESPTVPSTPVLAAAATRPAAAIPAYGPQEKGSPDTHALLVFYKDMSALRGVVDSSVFLDDVELARMDNKRYFGVWVTPGTHALQIRVGCSPVSDSTDFLAGQMYFLKVGAEGTNCYYLRGVNPDVASSDVRKLRPLSPTHVVHPHVLLAPMPLR